MLQYSFKKVLTLITLAFVIGCADDDEEIKQTPTNSTPTIEVAFDSLLTSAFKLELNPTGIAPLTAKAEFSTIEPSTVEIAVLGSIPVTKKFDGSSTNHTIDILGLYPATTNQVVIKLETAQKFASDTIQIVTDSLPSFLPRVEINVANTALMEEGMNFNDLSITDGTTFQPYPLAYDHEGAIRWYLNFDGIYPGFVSPMERLENGNILFETGKSIVEADMMGRIKKTVNLPAGYDSHHDVIALPNGNYVVAVDKPSNQITINGAIVNTVEDVMIEIDGTTGALVEEWNFAEIFDVDREDVVALPSPLGNVVDWYHQNAVYYSEIDDSFIISGRNQGLAKVGRNNDLKWILSPHRGWGNAGATGNGSPTKPFLLTAVDQSESPYDSLIQDGANNSSDFDWAWTQHAPLILPNGNLLVFDNGANRNFIATTPTSGYSRAVEYKIDEVNKTVQQVWSYGENRGSETFSMIISDVDYLPNTGNVLFSPGVMFASENYSKIIELSRPGGQVVFEGSLYLKNERLGGTPPSGPVFGQLDITYRAERMTLYP